MQMQTRGEERLRRHGTVLRAGFVALLLGATLAACDTTRSVGYDTTPVTRSAQPRLSVTLALTPFRDERRSHKQSAVLFRGDRETEIRGKYHCVNAEEHYDSDRVAKEITLAVKEHLTSRGAFAKVVVGGKSKKVDYRLSGVVSAFYGVQETSTAAQIGDDFGLVGALVTAGVTTEGRVVITLSQLQLDDAAGQTIATLEDVRLDFQGEMPVDADCWSIYDNVNLKLRDAVEQLVTHVERVVRDAHHPGGS